MPESMLRCIDSWRRFFPGYEIKEWNESNFDVNLLPYTQEAYTAKKYAFVSDVARFWVLYHVGGIYFDTDVEIISSFDEIITKGAFMGVESHCKAGEMPNVNPGLGLGAEKGNPVIKSIFDYYNTLRFLDEDGEKNPGTVVTHTTHVLYEQYGLKSSNEIQELNGITIYPMDYFCPFDDLTGVLRPTANTRSIHWFAKTWTDQPMWYFKMTRVLHRIFGVRFFNSIKSLLGIREGK
jgi:mannosyltransferase OCH1-like enzyme